MKERNIVIFFKNLRREKQFSRVRWLFFERTQKKKVSNEISKELTELDMLKTEHSYHWKIETL